MNIKNIFFAIIISNVALINATTPTAAYEFSPSEKQELHKATINGACLGAKEGIKISAISGAVGATFGILFTGILWYCDAITLPTSKEAALKTLKNAATSDVTKITGGIAATFMATTSVFGALIMRHETELAIKDGTYYQPYSSNKIYRETSTQLKHVVKATFHALDKLSRRS